MDGDEQTRASGYDVRPIPDPTILTTQQLTREIAALREILEAQIAGHRESLEIRIAGMDTAIKLAQRIEDRQAYDIKQLVEAIQIISIHEEKFRGIERQFKDNNVSVDKAAAQAEKAIVAAFAAAKEAVAEQAKSSTLTVDKSEKATNEKIIQLSALISSATDAFNSKIDDLKERLGRIEGTGIGTQRSWQLITGAVVLVGGLLGILAYVK